MRAGNYQNFLLPVIKVLLLPLVEHATVDKRPNRKSSRLTCAALHIITKSD